MSCASSSLVPCVVTFPMYTHLPMRVPRSWMGCGYTDRQLNAALSVQSLPAVISSPPAGVLQDLLLLLLAWVRLHGAHSPSLVTPLSCQLLGLLVGRSADGPVDLTEDVGFDGWHGLLATSPGEGAGGHSPSTQYGHRICKRFTRPHPEHLFSDVMSFNPFPAMNRCRFLRYDVFFLGTALRMPSQISESDGIDGSDSEGMARAPNGVLSAPNGCVRRCRKGGFNMGRMGPLRPGSSVCHSGGSGRASAIVLQMRDRAVQTLCSRSVRDADDGVANCRRTPVRACSRALPPSH